ncbi:MAG TPA: phosphate ABC transporter permease PstA [Candidatus Limnocylindria bacterium]|nr:phosphate ABC transporter permease PstA [Candidatus Limnocylindria bacterium]
MSAEPLLRSHPLRATQPGRRRTEAIVRGLAFAAGAVALLPLVLVIAFLLVEGLRAWTPAFLVSPPGGLTTQGGGALHAIVGTLEMVGLALLIATPFGLAVALYVVEYRAGRLALAVRTAVDLVAGIPSIVIGLFVYALVVLTTGHFSGYAGALALALIMLPIIARTSEEMLKIIPRRMREGTMALGMPRWRAIVAIYLPTVASGITTGIVLAVSRAIGETAPLLFTTLGSNFVETDMAQPMSALPLYMFQNALNIGFPAARERAWAAGLTLVAIVLIFNLLGRWLSSRTRLAGGGQ